MTVWQRWTPILLSAESRTIYDDASARKGVTVTIRAQGGEVLEEGAAVWSGASALWTYTTTTALAQGQSVSIDVSATDRPGHKTTKTQARN